MRGESTPSWILFSGCLGVGFGIAAVSWLSGVWIVVMIAIAMLAMAWCVRSLSVRGRTMLVGAFLLGVTVGVGRYALSGPGVGSVANIVGSSAVVEGRIVSTNLTDKGVTYVIDALLVDDVRYEDRVRLEAPISSTARIGEVLRVSCVLEEPKAFSGFAYDRFLAAKSIYAICRSSSTPFIVERGNISMSDQFYLTVGKVHAWMSERTRAILPEPQATLLLGLLIGENSFSDVWNTKFQATGTSHIVAASGYNVAVVAQLALIFFVSLGLYRKQAYPLVVACIVGFVVLAGAGGAVVRAGVMGILALTARHMGRHASPRNILVITIVLMLIFEPRLLRDDVGFQLSVAATIGLIVLTDRVSSVLKRVPTTFGVRESLASTLAATVATLPVTMFTFGKVSIVAPVVNMLVLPFIPYAMAFGGVAVVLGSLVHGVGVWLALPAWTVLSTMTGVIDAFSRIPFAAVTVSHGASIVLSVFALGGAVGVGWALPPVFERNLDSWNVRRAAVLVAVVFGLFMIHVGRIAWNGGRFNGAQAHVFVFDVGQGDGMMIVGQDGVAIIDGGPTRFGLVENMAEVRFPWERNIDVILASHPHADHVNGLFALANRYDIHQVVMNGSLYNGASAEEFRKLWPGAEVAEYGDVWSLGDDEVLSILWPEKGVDDVTAANVHERSVVAKLRVGEMSMLFTGDAEADVEVKLGDIGHIDVLKVGHHGSDTSTSEAFLAETTPTTAIISVGEGNSYGHPSPFTLGRLASHGVEVLRTDEMRMIRCDFWEEYLDCRGFVVGLARHK